MVYPIQAVICEELFLMPHSIPPINVQMLTKAELLAKYEKDGLESFSPREARRLKKLVTLEDIKEHNLSSSMSMD